MPKILKLTQFEHYLVKLQLIAEYTIHIFFCFQLLSVSKLLRAWLRKQFSSFFITLYWLYLSGPILRQSLHPNVRLRQSGNYLQVKYTPIFAKGQNEFMKSSFLPKYAEKLSIFLPSLHRAEILTNFRSYLGRNDDFIN